MLDTAIRHPRRLCMFWFAVAILTAASPAIAGDAKPLRIIAFGAHPDDNEIRLAGCAALWAKQGHQVKFVSVTNGDVGHATMAGGPLAIRRTAEVQAAAKILGIENHVLDIHDGELWPALEYRKMIIRLIRDWQADLVFSHRPNDYHPDHRYTGVLVQDAAFMVTVPFVCPDTKPLERNPVFLYYYDRFQRPYPFTPSVAVSIDDVIEQKLAALAAMPSQFIEGGASGAPPLPKDDAPSRRERIETTFLPRFREVTHPYRDLLRSFYGPERGGAVRYAEVFEVCEYGRQPSREELRRLFPFFEERK